MSKRALAEYRRKRDFRRTKEPRGRRAAARPPAPAFVVQKHAARRLHYDFRLEMEGTLRSWAVPKGPSLDPSQKRLAVHVEDHPLEYGSFEGEIPQGEYGGGTVLLWDRGTWAPIGDPAAGYRKGRLRFRLEGEKLKGAWSLVAMRGRAGEGRKNWLLVKAKDEHARAGEEIVEERRALGRAPLPGFIEPQLAARAERVPLGEEWLHELKLDGYRIHARVEGGRARLLSRNRNDWTRRFPAVASALGVIAARQAYLDGEIVVLDGRGRSDFQALQNSLEDGSADRAVFYAFDLLHLDGRDLRRTPLSERKAALRALLAAASPGGDPTGGARVRYAEHIEGRGEDFLKEACALALEGVISKRRDRPYSPGRGTDWLKVKCLEEQEFVVGGFSDPRGSRAAFGSLLLGLRERDGRLRYAGRVGAGFSGTSLRAVRRRLLALTSEEPPFADPPRARDAHWIRPELVAEVAFSGWTRDGLLRQPVFRGLREDKAPSRIRREAPRPVPAPARGPASVGGVRLTHPDRVVYPEQGLTKRAIAEFYLSVAGWILPHVAGRPLAVLRCPEGRAAQCFFQKHVGDAFPEHVRGGSRPYLYIEDERGLLSLVQAGALELHPWGSRVGDVERPDRLTFDLDPGPDVPWARMVEAARELRERLERLGLQSFLKTTGGKGLHIVVPLEPDSGWDAAKAFAKGVAESMARDSPARYTATMSKAARTGRIFVDYLRNGRGATAVAAYSTRARPGAPVSTPVDWRELGPALKPDGFTVSNLGARLRSRRDPWKSLTEVRQSLRALQIPEPLQAISRNTKQ